MTASNIELPAQAFAGGDSSCAHRAGLDVARLPEAVEAARRAYE